jgi:hypothetical protein
VPSHWIEVVLTDGQGTPYARTPFTLRASDGTELDGVTDGSGFSRLEDIPHTGTWHLIVEPPPLGG